MTADLPMPEADTVLSLLSEELLIERHAEVTGRVRVQIRTVERDALVEEILGTERIEIERVPIGRVVDAAPPIREEGDTTVISVMEEVIVTERRLVLKEEIRLRRVRTTTSHRETHTVREQHAEIERTAPEAGGSRPDFHNL